MSSRRWFGTDGIRGVANEHPLEPGFVSAFGRMLGRCPAFLDGPCLVARDPRRSGQMLESALVSGLLSAGRDVRALGVAPTPLAAWLACREGHSISIVLSASHNPEADNGIKLFGSGGEKLEDAQEAELEKMLESPPPASGPCGELRLDTSGEATREYAEHLRQSTGLVALAGKKLVVDCANGAMTAAAREVFSHSGAEVIFLGDQPGQGNINENCGCMHPERMREAVRGAGADAGVAFDGDGDRVVMCDRDGHLLDGDDLLSILASNLSANKIVVCTVMSNEGLLEHFRRQGLEGLRAGVGDRQVLQLMRQVGSVLGGEQSGHIVQRNLTPTGDGLAAAMSVLAIAGDTELSEYRRAWTRWPQVQRNIRLPERKPWVGTPVEDELRAMEGALEGHGRHLLRYSGTESLLRLLLEGREAGLITEWADRMEAVIRRELGGAT